MWTLAGRALAQARGQRRVELDRDHLARARGQGQGERARARADLEERLVRARIHHAQQALDGGGTEEVLSQAAGHGAEIMGRRAGNRPVRPAASPRPWVMVLAAGPRCRHA